MKFKFSLQFCVRIILTCLLIVGVYSETGIYTAIFAGLLALDSELSGFALRNHGKSIKLIMSKMGILS